MNFKSSKSWKLTVGMILVAVVTILLPSFGIESISESQVQNLIYMALGISVIGTTNKGIKRFAERKTKVETEPSPVREKLSVGKQHVEDEQKRLHRLENDKLENLKNRLGLASSEPTSKIIDELVKFSTKSRSTLNAVGITKEDYNMMGLALPPSLI